MNKTSEIQKKATLNIYSGLYTDMYELTMAQGYFLTGRKNETAVFDYFFRNNPFEGGFVIFAGLGDLLEVLEGLTLALAAIDCWYCLALNSLTVIGGVKMQKTSCEHKA